MKRTALVLGCLLSGSACLSAAKDIGVASLESPVMHLELSLEHGTLSLLDKRSNLSWSQAALPGFKVDPETVQSTGTSITCRVIGGGKTYDVSIALTPNSATGFELTINLPNEHYTWLPAYPFPFAPSQQAGWYYVQNTSGEGMLIPLERFDQINKPYGWSGSQPWWGITDLERGLAVRLDSFRNPDTSTGHRDSTVYAFPMHLHYELFNHGGYVAMAEFYRQSFLAAHPDVKPLRDRVSARPAVGMLKDGVYVYLWGDNPAEDLELVKEMKEAGIERGLAVFYGRHPITRDLFNGIKKLGWVPGMYQMPTGNLFRLGRHGWANGILTGELGVEELRRGNNSPLWDRICGKYQLKRWLEKAKTLLASYGPQLFYFDTLVVQLAPCLSSRHPSTIEENQQSRLEIARKTQELGTLVGSGEGLSPTWALPGLDFYEGLMSLRTYADPELKIPRGDYKTDMGESYGRDAAFTLDEKRRIPLFQLAFHDYVAGTWVWRDTNFQSRPYAWKKDLFNILYGTMPMWHIDRQLWDNHKAEYVSSYRSIASVRARLGFARMIGHGWLSSDRSVQYTDWDNGDRVVVNFGSNPFVLRRGKVEPRSFVVQSGSDR